MAEEQVRGTQISLMTFEGVISPMISSPWAYFFETLITLSESGLHKAEPNPNYWADGKESTCQCRRLGFDPQGRSPGGGNDNPLQYSCLDNPKDRGAWQATVHGVTKSQT